MPKGMLIHQRSSGPFTEKGRPSITTDECKVQYPMTKLKVNIPIAGDHLPEPRHGLRYGAETVQEPGHAPEFDAAAVQEPHLNVPFVDGRPDMGQGPAQPGSPSRSVRRPAAAKAAAKGTGKTAAVLRPVLPLNAASILPAATVYRMVGLPDYGDVAVPMVRPGDAPDDDLPWPRLVLRMPQDGGNRGTWVIHDNMGAVERRLLGRSDSRVRISTGCKEGREQEAIERLRAYVDLKRDRMLGRILPTQISMMSLFIQFERFLDDGAEGLAKGTISTYRIKMRPLIGFFGHRKLGGIDRQAGLDYAVWRRAQPVKCNGIHGRLVSARQVEHEMSLLRRIWNHYRAEGQCNLQVDIHVPKAPRVAITHLRRLQLARYFWATRGRIWNTEMDRWRILRDDDPSLVGPEGDARVLRNPEIVAGRESLQRMLLLGVYTGSRVQVLIETCYDDDDVAHVDWARGTIERRGLGEKESAKRRPAVLLPSKILRFLTNWAERDRASGIRHPIHKSNGEPYKEPITASRWRALDADAGCNLHAHAHVLRHTCAMYLKANGVSSWVAAEYLGCTPEVLVENYGEWDVENQRAAAEAVGLCRTSRPAELSRIRFAPLPKNKLH